MLDVLRNGVQVNLSKPLQELLHDVHWPAETSVGHEESSDESVILVMSVRLFALRAKAPTLCGNDRVEEAIQQLIKTQV